MSEAIISQPLERDTLWYVEIPWEPNQRLAGMAAVLLNNTLLGNYYHSESQEASFLAVQLDITGNGIRDPRLFIATDARSVKGALIATKDPLPLSQTEVKLFAVEEELRNKGVGSKLLQHTEQQLHASGVRRLRLTPTYDARNFYERHGYVGVGDENKRDFYMKKRLKKTN